ncbi:MAG TPA: prolipoprotein diacylglyceryl transferase [Alphaproteobacteria bacterium]|jgi:phosphatidylglycerol:prolipoprotein diacylglycerol transferase|nr:prolipoprotein diacylglyceryl transferase [Alphaproteobacteria bacterium]
MALTYPKIDPVALKLGPVSIRWYGLAYITGLILGWRYTVWLARQRRFNGPDSRPTVADLDDFLFWAMAGVLIGGRLGIVLFYQPSFYFAHPANILRIWDGGMSFHGGMLGVTTALIWFTRSRKIRLFDVSDLVACATPIGLFFGRLANFVNGELWGRVTDSPLGMVFPGEDAGPLPRYPSQLFEAASEGVILFVLLAILAQQPAIRSRRGLLTGLFLIGYGVARSVCELFREPDSYLGFVLGGVISMGQVLSFPMLLAGLAMAVYAYRVPPRPTFPT